MNSGLLFDDLVLRNQRIGLESAAIGQHDAVANGKQNIFDSLVFLNPIVQGCDRPRVLIPRLRTLPPRSMLSRTISPPWRTRSMARS